MKKILLPLVFAATIAFTAISCNKDGKKAEKQSSVNIEDENDANKIIEFNNKYIDLDRRQRSNVDRLVDFADNALRKIQGDRFAIANAIVVPNIGSVKEVPNLFGKEQAEMEKIFTEQQKIYADLNEKKEALQSYLKAEDFKDDQGAKGKTLADEIVKLAEQYYSESLKFSEKLRPIADDAEAIILKDHPLKEHIIGSKKALNEVESAYLLIIEQYNNETYDGEKINGLYAKIENELKNNTERSFDTSDPTYARKENSYKEFNKEIETFLGALRKLNRDSEQTKTIKEHQIRQIESAYNSVISDYNSFVK